MKGASIIRAGHRASVESPSLTWFSTRMRWLLLVAAAVALLWTTLAIDTMVERYFLSFRLPSTARDLLNVAETFGNGFGVLLILVLIVVLDPRHRAATLRLVWCSLGAGLTADIVKLFISRARPKSFDLDLANAWDTFGPMMPFMTGGSPAQSFPSAHMATAAGLAVGLAAIYPRGRYLFLTLAVAVGLQRMIVGAHYPSDVLVGAMLGTLWASYCQPGTRLGDWIGRWENWIAEMLAPTKFNEPPATLKFPSSQPIVSSADPELREAA